MRALLLAETATYARAQSVYRREAEAVIDAIEPLILADLRRQVNAMGERALADETEADEHGYGEKADEHYGARQALAAVLALLDKAGDGSREVPKATGFDLGEPGDAEGY